MPLILKRKKFFYIAFCLVLILDRFSKLIAITQNENFTKNPGIAFGLGQEFSKNLFFLILLGLIILIFILRKVDLNLQNNQIALGMVIAGAISNILDRLFYGYVIDFINLFSLSAFNLADVAILVGSLMLIKYFWSSPEVK